MVNFTQRDLNIAKKVVIEGKRIRGLNKTQRQLVQELRSRAATIGQLKQFVARKQEQIRITELPPIKVTKLPPTKKLLTPKLAPLPITPTYDISTKTFTDPSGRKMSMSFSQALKSGAILRKMPAKAPPKVKLPSIVRTGQIKKRLRPISKTILPTIVKTSKRIESLKPRAKRRIIRGVDVISGGAITSFRLGKREEALNKEIQDFNRKFAAKELSELEYKKSMVLSRKIEQRERKLKQDKAKLEKTFARKYMGGWIWGTGEHSIVGATEKASLSKENRKNLEKDLEGLKKKRAKAKFGLNKKRLDLLIEGKEKEINDRKAGMPQKMILGSPPPLTPAITVPKEVNIQFIGKQVVKGKKILTDVIFRQGKRIGLAKGATITKGPKGTSVVLGKSGVQGYQFPTGKPVIKQIQTLVGREVAKTKPSKFQVKQSITLLKKAKKIGKIDTIKKNIKGLQQAGVGRTATVKGHKFYKTAIRLPSGKLTKVKAKGVKVDDFASLSSIFTKKDLSLIIGKTITTKSGKANFIGLIKGTSKAGKNFRVSPGQQQQFNEALGKVMSVAASSLAKAEKVKGLTKVGTIAQAGTAIKVGLKQKKPVKIRPKVKVPTKITPKKIITPKKVPLVSKITPKQIQKFKSTKQKLRKAVKEETKIQQKIKSIQKTKIKGKSKIKIAQNIRIRQKQLQLQRSKLLRVQKQKQVLKQGIKALRPPIPTIPKIPPIPPRVPKKRKVKVKKKVSKKPKTGYYVYEKRGKAGFKKLKGPPLTKKQAKDRLAYRLDNKISRTAKLVPVKTKTLGKLKTSERGYFNRYKKNLRNYKIVKGKRVKTPLTFIEKKGKGVINTPGEKRQLALNRRARRKKIKLSKTRKTIRSKRPIKKSKTKKKKMKGGKK